ncbi:hypothetical protein CHL78_011575 [Romboutsia weinsteinii]|uniref:Uncharacterized protein n=1 Tax=Romboutsia weinsteinii TaxID=2020949 RepID=A0A371J2C6_9FIRM|nr:hypothetical protein [Romboutsia weinsteinii]RDY26833.1 hypothetical protein CHL78_011575 [Romboutsia weinsteinii]
MKNIILCELDRTIKSRKNKVLFAVSIIIFILLGLFIKMFNVGFYDPETTIALNSLNTAPFIIREIHLYLLFVFCPMIFIESFNHENTSGAYRMVLVRGYKKKDYIISKLISCAIITAIFTIIIYIVGTLFGYLVMDKVEVTKYFNINKEYNLIGALFYNLKFYILEYLIMLTVLGISSIIGLLSKNSAIAYILSIGVCVGSIYISDSFEFFLTSTKTIFDVLANMNSTFVITCIIIIVLSSLSSIYIFDKRDYLN